MSILNGEMAAKIDRLCGINHARNGFLPVIEKFREGDPPGKVSPQWAAWRAFREKHNVGVVFMDTRTQWTVPSEYPPVDIDGSLIVGRKPKLREKLEA